MPETPDDGLPGQQPQPLAPGLAPADPASTVPRRRSAWRRRRVLIPAVAAVAAAVAAAVVLWPGPWAQEYRALPPPCTLVTTATLAKYVPGATGKPLSPPAGGCEWHGISGSLGQRDLLVSVAVFGSSSGVAQARQLFDLDAHATAISAPHITFTVTRRPLPGLGDQAMVQIYQPSKNVVPPAGGRGSRRAVAERRVLCHLQHRSARSAAAPDQRRAGLGNHRHSAGRPGCPGQSRDGLETGPLVLAAMAASGRKAGARA